VIALAIKKAQSTPGSKLQSALERLGSYDGLVKTYAIPFSPANHEVLGPSDYLMTPWKGACLGLIGEHHRRISIRKARNETAPVPCPGAI